MSITNIINKAASCCTLETLESFGATLISSAILNSIVPGSWLFNPFARNCALVVAGTCLGARWTQHPNPIRKTAIDLAFRLIQKSSRGKPLKALIIEANHDYNGVFSGINFLRCAKQLAKTHSIDRFTTDNQSHSTIDKIKSLMGKYDLVWLRAHGTPQEITLDRMYMLSTDYWAKSSRRTLEALKEIAASRVKIILESCSTGLGKNCIAEHISAKIPGSTVYAPTYDLLQRDLKFKEGGVPVMGSEETTRVFIRPPA